MRKLFGRNIDDSGTEILIKLGSRYPDINDPRHYTSWRDGQVIEISPIGFNSGKRVGYSSLLLQFPNIRYQGRNETNFKLSTPIINDFRKFTYPKDISGKHPWDYKSKNQYVKSARKRDYFIDTLWLLEKHYISLGEYEVIYDFSRKSDPVIIQDSTFTHLLKHEDEFERSCIETDTKKASIAQDGAGSGTGGGFTIGAAGDYATVTAFEADLAATLTADLHGLHLDEETVITGAITFNCDTTTNSCKLFLTAENGDEHNGIYGNSTHQAGDGARITCGTSDRLTLSFSNNTDKMEVSKLVFGISGAANSAAQCFRGNILLNRLIVEGDADSNYGLLANRFHGVIDIRNNTIYNIGDSDEDSGIYIGSLYTDCVINVDNNTVMKNYYGIHLNEHDGDPVINLKNNICQGNGTDYVDNSVNHYDATAVNISEDATSPDASYQSKDLHTNTIFEDYASNDYRLDSGGDATNLAIADDGEDLSGTFTDDNVGNTRSVWYAGAFEIIDSGISASIIESVSLSDSSECQINFSSSETEALSLNDSPSGQAEFSSGILENVSLSDIPLSNKITISSVNENISLVDSPSVQAEFSSAISESLSLSDSSSAEIEGGLEVSIIESLSLSDTISAQSNLSVSTEEDLSISDTIGSNASKPASSTESISLTDSPSCQTVKASAINESITLSESCDATITFGASVSENINLTDAISNSLTANAFSSEPINLNESSNVNIVFQAQITENLSLSDISNFESEEEDATSEKVGALCYIYRIISKNCFIYRNVEAYTPIYETIDAYTPIEDE